jgi:hypothetical protein
MRRVVVCPTDFLFRLFQGASGNADSWVFLVSDVKTRSGLARQDASALAGALDDPGLYRRAHLSSGDLVMLMAPERPRRGASLARILEAILEVAPDGSDLAAKLDADVASGGAAKAVATARDLVRSQHSWACRAEQIHARLATGRPLEPLAWRHLGREDRIPEPVSRAT